MTRDTKTLLYGGATICAIVLIGKVVPLGVRWTADERNAAAEAQRQWLLFDTNWRVFSSLRDSAQARRLRLGDEVSSLLSGATPDAAAAALAQLMKDAGESAGVKLGSVDLRLDTSRVSVFARHRASADIVGDVRGILTFLAELEASETRVRVVAMAVSQGEPFAGPRQPEALRMNIVVEALARRPLPASKLPTVARKI